MVPMRSVKGLKCAASIGRLVITHIKHVDHIFIFCVGVNPRIIPGPLAELSFTIHLGPFLTSVV